MNERTSTDLQTPATELTAAEQLAAGHGGSYRLDPKTGDVTLAERTQYDGPLSRKHPDAPRGQPAPAAPDAGADFAG